MDVIEVATHGVSRRTALTDATDEHVEELQINGFTIVDSTLSEESLADLRHRLDHVYSAQQSESALHLKDSDVARCPLAYDEVFLSVATNRALMTLCQRLFGENFVLLQQNGVINRPRSTDYQTRWHRDLSYQHFVVSSKIAINALFCLDDFTSETGGTFVLPGTHLFEFFPSDRYVLKHEKVAAATAGSILVMDAMLFHRAGYNTSGAMRRGLNHLIGRPFLAQQIDIPKVLKHDMSSDAFLRRYLGYQWNPAPDVETWRSRRP